MPPEPHLVLPIQATVVRYRLGGRGRRRPLAPAVGASAARDRLRARGFAMQAAPEPQDEPQSWRASSPPGGFFLPAPAIDIPVRDPPAPGNPLVFYLRDPPSDQDPGNPPGQVSAEGCPPNFGSDPNDPAWFSSQVDPRSGICSLLSSYAVGACLRRGRYF